MLFDWFTVAAQIVNFLILMYLLKRFLYKPVLDAIDARERRIANLLNDAKTSQEKAAKQQAELTRKNAAFESEKTKLFEQVKAQAATQSAQMLEKVAKDVAKQREQWLQALQNEQDALDQTISQRTRQEIIHLARRTLADLSDTELEQQIVNTLLRRVKNMSTHEHERFEQTAVGEQQLILRSAFNFTDEQQALLSQSIQELLPSQPSIRFEIDTTLLGGVELIGNGHKLSWNITAYISDLNASIKRIIESKRRFSKEQVHEES